MVKRDGSVDATIAYAGAILAAEVLDHGAVVDDEYPRVPARDLGGREADDGARGSADDVLADAQRHVPTAPLQRVCRRRRLRCDGLFNRGRAERVAEAVEGADEPCGPRTIAKSGADLSDQPRQGRSAGHGIRPQHATQIFMSDRLRPPSGERFEQQECLGGQWLHLSAPSQLAHLGIENAVRETDSHRPPPECREIQQIRNDFGDYPWY